MSDTLELVDLESLLMDSLSCVTPDCGNEATLIMKHGHCTSARCLECKWTIQHSIILAAEEGSELWCPVCEISRPVTYWMDNIQFIPI